VTIRLSLTMLLTASLTAGCGAEPEASQGVPSTSETASSNGSSVADSAGTANAATSGGGSSSSVASTTNGDANPGGSAGVNGTMTDGATTSAAGAATMPAQNSGGSSATAGVNDTDATSLEGSAGGTSLATGGAGGSTSDSTNSGGSVADDSSAGGSNAQAGAGALGSGGAASSGGGLGSGGSMAAAGSMGMGGSGVSVELPEGCELPETVSFQQDVQPFLIPSCGGGNGCHVIDDSSTMSNGGYNHAYDWITAGSHTSSCPDGPFRFEIVVDVINEANPASCSNSRKMPPPENGDRTPLTECQVATLQAWLDEPLVTQTHREDDSSPTTPYAMPPFN